jgi:hypothetical protein
MIKKKYGLLLAVPALLMTLGLAGCGKINQSKTRQAGSDSVSSSSAQTGHADNDTGDGVTSGSVSSESVASQSTADKEKPVVLAFSLADGQNHTRWEEELKVLKEAAADCDAKIRVMDAEGDSAKQAKQCDALLTSETLSALICLPADVKQAAAIVSSAHDVGVPVIAYGTMIEGVNPNALVTGAGGADPGIPHRNLARAAVEIACAAARGYYLQTIAVSVEGNWMETSMDKDMIPTFIVTDPIGENQTATGAVNDEEGLQQTDE